jgi:hypothetical protein
MRAPVPAGLPLGGGLYSGTNGSGVEGGGAGTQAANVRAKAITIPSGGLRSFIGLPCSLSV